MERNDNDESFNYVSFQHVPLTDESTQKSRPSKPSTSHGILWSSSDEDFEVSRDLTDQIEKWYTKITNCNHSHVQTNFLEPNNVSIRIVPSDEPAKMHLQFFVLKSSGKEIVLSRNPPFTLPLNLNVFLIGESKKTQVNLIIQDRTSENGWTWDSSHWMFSFDKESTAAEFLKTVEKKKAFQLRECRQGNKTCEIELCDQQMSDFVVGQRENKFKGKFGILCWMDDIIANNMFSKEVSACAVRAHCSTFYNYFGCQTHLEQLYSKLFCARRVRGCDVISVCLWKLMEKTQEWMAHSNGAEECLWVHGDEITTMTFDGPRISEGIETGLARRLKGIQDRQEIPIQDSVIESILKETKENEAILSVVRIQFDDRVLVIRNGAIFRCLSDDLHEIFQKIAQIRSPIVNGLKIVCAQTYIDQIVYHVRKSDCDDTLSLTYEEIVHFQDDDCVSESKETDEMEISPCPRLMSPSPSSCDCEGHYEEICEDIEEKARVLQSMSGVNEYTKKTSGNFLIELMTWLIEPSEIPVLAIFERSEEMRQLSGVRKLCHVKRDEIDVANVLVALVECKSAGSIMGIVEEKEETQCFEISANWIDGIEPTISRMKTHELFPAMIVSKPTVNTIRIQRRDETNISWDLSDLSAPRIGKMILREFVSAQILRKREVLDMNLLQEYIEVCSTVTEWTSESHANKCIVIMTESDSFDIQTRRLRQFKIDKTMNSEFDPFLTIVSKFSKRKLKAFIRNDRNNGRSMYVVIVDRGVYTIRAIDIDTPQEEIFDAVCEELKVSLDQEESVMLSFSGNEKIRQKTIANLVREKCMKRGLCLKVDMADKEEFKCVVCYESAISFCSLSCGHMMCQNCLRMQFLSDVTVCPLCRHNLMSPFMIPKPCVEMRRISDHFFGRFLSQQLKYKTFAQNVEWQRELNV